MANFSRLDLCNQVLINCGVRRVGALDTGGASEVADAEFVLNYVSRDIQAAGLAENRLTPISHTADANGFIILGTTVIDIKAAGPSEYRHLTMRLDGATMKCFDNDRNTYVFTVGERIYLWLTEERPPETMSPRVQSMIVKNATQIYARQFANNPLRNAMLDVERIRAEVNLGNPGEGHENPAPFAPRPSGGQGQ